MQTSEYQGRLVGAASGSFEFMNKLELYLHQRRTGTAPYYTEVPGELSDRMHASSRMLAQTDVKALRHYSGYLTAFTYDRKARFISQSSETLGTAASLNTVA